MPPECSEAMLMYAGVCGNLCGNEHLRPREGKRAMNENFWDMWKFTFCPQFRVVSFTFFMVSMNLFIWILTLVFSEVYYDKMNNAVFLGPDTNLLNKWGAKNPTEIQQNYQLWRLITPAFLSNGFSQCFIGIFLLLLIGSMIESAGMGTFRLASLFFISTAGGYLFGATCAPDLSVGVLPGVFGLTAALFSNVIKNWKALEKLDSLRFFLIIFAMGIFAVALMITINSVPIGIVNGAVFKSSDVYSNLGGFIIGIFVAMVVIKPTRGREAELPKSFESIVTIVGLVGSAIFFLVMFLVFFFAATR